MNSSQNFPHTKKQLKSWQQEIYSTSLHVNFFHFFQNNIQMKCLLTLNLLTVTFFLSYFIHTVFWLLTQFSSASCKTFSAGWDGQTWFELTINFILFFCLNSSCIVFILIPSSSHHTHPFIHNQNSQFFIFIPYVFHVFGIWWWCMLIIVGHLRVHETSYSFEFETKTRYWVVNE